MSLNITEGMFLHEVATLATENHIGIHVKSRFGTSIKDRVEVDGKKIWFPRDYRAEKNELLTEELKMMKLKEMGTDYGGQAFFLEPNDSHITEGMNFREFRNKSEYSHKLIIYADNSLVQGIKIGGVPIYFPLINRMTPANFDISEYDNFVLRKSEGDRLQYFLVNSPTR